MPIKFERNKKYATISIYAFLALCAVVIVYLVLRKFIEPLKIFAYIVKILAPIVYGLVIAYLLNPILEFCEKHVFWFLSIKKPRKKLKRILSLIVTYILMFAFLAVFIYMLASQTYASFRDLMKNLDKYLLTLQNFILDLIDRFETSTGISTGIDDLESDVKNKFNEMIIYISNNWRDIVNVVLKIVTVAKDLLLGLIISVYLLLSKEKLIAQVKKCAQAFMSEKTYLRVSHIVRTTDKTFGRFIMGKLIDSLIVGILFYIVFSILGFPYVPVIAFILGVCNIIPFFGPWIGSVPCGLIILIVSPQKFLLFALVVLIVQQIDGNIIDPLIVGDSIGLDAIWIIIAIIVMTGILGVLGMFIGVPLFSVIYILIKEKVNKNLESKGKSLELETYYPEPKL